MIKLISNELIRSVCNVIHAHDNADVDIAKEAVKSSQSHVITLIGDDTDLLILLLYTAKLI